MITKYEIRFFRVGTASKGGDAIFIRLYDEYDHPTVIVIDGGYTEDGNKIIRYMVDKCGLNTIDLIINTHPDIDHILGLIQLFKSDEIEIKKLVMNRPWRDSNLDCSFFKDGRITDKSLNERLTRTFRKAYELEKCAKEKIGENNIIHPVVGNTYFDCLTILAPNKEAYRSYLLESDKTPASNLTLYSSQPKKSKYATEFYHQGDTIKWFEDETTSPINETSIVSLLKLPKTNILFTGDAGKRTLSQALDELSNRFGDIKIHKMQLPHHGSRKNISPYLIKRINANAYYVSCPPEGLEEGHYSRRLTNMILDNNPDVAIFTTKNATLYTYSNLDIKGKPATKLDFSEEMDGQPN